MPETTAGRILGNTILNTKGDKIRHKGNKLVQILAFEINRATMITNSSWCILGSGAWTLSPLKQSPSTTGWRDISAALASSGLREGWTLHQHQYSHHIHDQSYLVCFNNTRVQSTSYVTLAADIANSKLSMFLPLLMLMLRNALTTAWQQLFVVLSQFVVKVKRYLVCKETTNLILPKKGQRGLL